MKRFIIEFGMGIDLHGQDVTHAAQKAIKDAMSSNCLAGLKEIFKVKLGDDSVIINATIACSRPEDINPEALVGLFPIGKVNIIPVKGGMKAEGMYIPAFGDKDESIEVVIAEIEVFVK